MRQAVCGVWGACADRLPRSVVGPAILPEPPAPQPRACVGYRAHARPLGNARPHGGASSRLGGGLAANTEHRSPQGITIMKARAIVLVILLVLTFSADRYLTRD